ncbi:MAG: hypothetical protein HKP58_09425 [Desulfatitalea sp.]|nr:hypothetical protein [Desulfatitalea sp.]NNK00622.1 hypothetical protein [Desulfatitalea sp.]
MGAYRLLFEITVCHPYFPDNSCRHLQWEPARATLETMSNLGMLFRPFSNGMAVYSDPGRRDAMALFAAQTEPDAPGFYFKAYVQDPFFTNYTQLPDIPEGRLLCVDTARAVAEPSGAFRLHPQAVVSDGDSTPLAYLWDKHVLVRRDKGAAPLCVFHIRPVGQDTSPMDAKGDLYPRTYRVYFDHRRTYWKYVVLGPLATQTVVVRDKDNHWTFDPVPANGIAGSRPAVAFLSNDPIPLKQIPNHTFQLKLRTADVEKVMMARLPVAPVNMLHREKRGAEVISISEIFINS